MQFFCAPTYPDRELYGLAVILHHLDYSVTLTPEQPFDVAVLWEDKTFVEVPETLRSIAQHKPVINIDCIDISKRRVEQAIKTTFNLQTFIDPLTYQGKCIKKPDGNAIRHGFVVECPQAKVDDDWVYQRIIETRVGGFQIEYRTPVILGEIPVVYESRRDYPTDDIRDCQRHQVTPKLPQEIFSPQEINAILQFSREIGMDLGELDIMRCAIDGQLYIIDANKTAAGYGLENRVNWSPGDRKKVIAVLAGAFERNIHKMIREYDVYPTKKAS